MNLRQTITLMSLGCIPAVSMADFSANVGMVSDYIYRGVFQSASSASAGLDYEDDNGFYIGAWGADVGDGIETDLYFGYGSEIGDFTWGIGYTGYYYTDTFDETYTEVNLSLGYGMFSLDVALGDYDIPDPTGDDYTFVSLTLELPNGPYFTYGSFGDEFDGDYLEIGYGFEWEGLDLSIALVTSDDPGVPGGLIIGPSADEPLAETALVFGISKSFAFGD
ncbi:MAG: TorF family putative porin [Gammaproteobacteria bacterium]|nr:TorF family putative porin [Gammaproteobacteria bacterium]